MAPRPATVTDSMDGNTAGLGKSTDIVTKPMHTDGIVLESWSQGYMVGSLIIMAAITIANMRRGVLLHKLILLELFLGMWHGTFMFVHEPQYGWYLSSTAIFLNMSWSLHNVIAWIKTKSFLSRRWSLLYIGTVILAQPYWVLEIYANFTYFNNINKLFVHTRPYEALFRDPWWVASTIILFWQIHTSYRLPFLDIFTISPRFAVLLGAMLLSIGFIIVDIVSVTSSLNHLLPDGLNPFWKMAFVFKCLTDSIVLDDFKTALDRLMRFKMQKDRFGTVGTLGATAGSSVLATDSPGGGFSYKTGEGTTTAAEGGFVNHFYTQGTRTPKRPSTNDPLGEDFMDQERYERFESQASAGALEKEKLRPLATAAPRAASGSTDTSPGSSTGRPDNGISFWDALTEGGDLEKNAAKSKGLSGRKDSSVGTPAMATHVEHWDDIDLPEFETEGKKENG